MKSNFSEIFLSMCQKLQIKIYSKSWNKTTNVFSNVADFAKREITFILFIYTRNA